MKRQSMPPLTRRIFLARQHIPAPLRYFLADHAWSIEDRAIDALTAVRGTVATVKAQGLAIRIAADILTGAHLHELDESKDCDGRLDHSRTVQPLRRVRSAWWLAWAVRDATRRSEANGWEGGYARADGGALVYGSPTEEGWSQTTVEACRDDCPMEHSQRDYTAEAAGY